MAPLWAIWCPRGDACNKKARVVAKGTTQEDVRERLKQHLRDAVGHEHLEEQEIELIASRAEIAEWDDNDSTRVVSSCSPPPPPSLSPSLNEIPRVWAIWCPRGDQRNKRNRVVAKSTTQENVRERLKQHLRDAAGHDDMDEQEIEVVANLAEVQEWEENEPMRTPAVRVPPPPPPSSMSLKRTRADMELVAVVSDPPSSNSLKRARANMELASVVSDVVTAGIQAFVYLHSCCFRSST